MELQWSMQELYLIGPSENMECSIKRGLSVCQTTFFRRRSRIEHYICNSMECADGGVQGPYELETQFWCKARAASV